MKPGPLLFAIASLLPSSLLGQEIVCDGVVTSYLKGVASQPVKDINFFAEGDALTLRSVLPEFPDALRNARFVMSRTQGLATLRYQENHLLTGGINRHTGEILLLLRSSDFEGHLDSMFSGICGPTVIDKSPLTSK